MRIGIDAHVITGKFQGTKTTLTKLLRSLALLPTEHEIILYVDDVEEAREVLGPNRYELRPLNCSSSIKRLMYKFPRLLKEDGIDLAVFQYNMPFFTDTPSIVFIHDILPITHPQFFPFLNRLRIQILFGRSIRKAAKVVTVSNYSRDSVLARYALRPEAVTTIFNGPSFDLDVFDEPRTSPARPYVMTVGRIEPRKNIAALVKAFETAELEGVDLKIVGKPDLGYDFKTPQSARVEVISDVNDQALIKLYREASLFVYPSFAEGFGIPLLDSLLFNLPTISSNQTAMNEIADGAATMFDPTATDAGANLATLIGDHFRGKPISTISPDQKALLEEKFSWDQAARNLLNEIDRLGSRLDTQKASVSI